VIGKHEEASERYQKALAIREQLVERDPANTLWWRDLASSYERIGDVWRAQGESSKALASYQKSLDIREKLVKGEPAEGEPANLESERQRDLAFSYERIGDVWRAQGESSKALASYQKSLDIREKLVKDPAKTLWQMDLVDSLDKIATLLEKQSPPKKEAAINYYQRILAILRPLAAANRLAADQKGRIADVEKRLDALKEGHE
jgi:tetratricopeptide (TPR) repeat protein